ncbi:hypothetical protein NCS57_00507900 [Fusarium keratoplasticum]|uniref:Uncharacterized protein n=1 Tax=Fusarium keratoplasticum TaxID=1328300 RepID=A0ACC0RAQ6_9HYPO|nr:hypothetical protein NCS57_00507900 [Fusarium keratoplasticum]KAI8664659.1 hypothetical protein NCS55_00975900 [Fusarium keratoplasticum]KAI8676046.1 hypothetical protein NCS57_00507900 [Fusarium keratoplasticum]
MLEEQFIEFSPGGTDLVDATILVDESDFAGVKIATRNLSQDFARVTKKDPPPVDIVENSKDITAGGSRVAIIVGSVESSPLLQRLERENGVQYSAIRGRWESFLTVLVDKPLGGCFDKALVIAGSDKRGAIFGIYTLSEQIGVSPWYWWADVPSKYHPTICASPKSTIQGEPSIKYRGIFLNDEAPAMTGWVLEKFGKYNSEFYKKVFELLLRLKANFMWPAMWPGYPNPGANFFLDDPDNQRVADEYGIVMSTSHHEPMQRLTNEWVLENGEGTWDWDNNKEKMTQFFEHGAQRAKGYESYFTIGMRGEYDRRIKACDPAAAISDAIKTQREVISHVYGSSDKVPQLLPLYRDIEQLYDTGRIHVPDDVTLLFQDDNNGTIRRLPTKKESARKGGSGLYYHFEYVGLPRSYKWINSVSLGKAWHQLRHAYNRNVREIWIFNVGDLKPLETPITWAMSLAWNINRITSENLGHFLQETAEKTFGSELSCEIGRVYHGYDRLVSLRKHELIEPTTFSLLHYNEAETILGRWEKLLEDAKLVYDRLTEEQKPAGYQLILHPVKSSHIFVALRVMQARNQLYARQRRNTANTTAQSALDLFDADFDVQLEYHSLLGGKWNQMLRQTHLGYEDTWHAPSRDMITGLGYVQRRQDSNPIVGQMGVSVEGHLGVRPGLINEESERTHPSRRDLVPGLTLGTMSQYGPVSRWFEIWNRGTPTINWTASTPYAWLQLSSSSGFLVPGRDDVRVHVTVDWNQVPDNFDQEVLIDVKSGIGDFEQIHVPIVGRRAPDTFQQGFIEGPGYVSMPATSGIFGHDYMPMPDCGRSEDGSVGLDLTRNVNDTAGFLAYHLYQFSDTRTAKVLLEFGITLTTSTEDVPSYDLQLNEGPVTHHNIEQYTEASNRFGLKLGVPRAEGWMKAASDLVWNVSHEVDNLKPGPQVVKIRLCHQNVLLEKVVVDFGGVRESYLGPPPSYKIEDACRC